MLVFGSAIAGLVAGIIARKAGVLHGVILFVIIIITMIIFSADIPEWWFILLLFIGFVIGEHLGNALYSFFSRMS